jgi:glycosyltransferase involved in cell wall biosynthesis
MKLIVQIPCFNEEHTLTQTVADIPRSIAGVDRVEILIIDDGSSDRTVEVARQIGVDHIILNKQNLGLATTFRIGIEECLKRGADVIVNTDGDNQYCGADIPKLIQPILNGSAEIVIGDRQTNTIHHFSIFKKALQKIGSSMVRLLSGIQVPDAVSGFRAMSRHAALQLNIVSSFSYTTEMLIQIGRRGIATTSVPVGTNPKTRESRLFSNVLVFIAQSLTTMVRMYAMYRPLKVFTIIGSALMLIGIVPIGRFLYFVALGQSSGRVQSLVIGAVFLIWGALTLLIGLLADLIAANRQLIEMTLVRVRGLELAILHQVDKHHANEFSRPGAFDDLTPGSADAKISALPKREAQSITSNNIRK